MTELAHGAWVLVADGEKALFLENVTDGQDPFLKVVRMESQDNPPMGEQVSDKPGRMADSGVGQRSSMEEADWHMLAKDRFAAEMSDILYRLAHRNAFDQIVLVAPPRTLGTLRDKLHKEVSARVVAEIDKDMTNHPIGKIESLLKAELARGS
ncbi:protein required for attachment to host cells [Roseovarius halotolerans]|uniref:Protein required for attachment to host cells n=1 Tax=Roseovarius halotolerans TaxID=505353 RepID=A0A1X6YGP5_9RHOB|nr:host attachment family protein [Roseovarius halotolerans]RKT34653.1 protein required for attachment to host cells [Roseovarius halotolerans]SLN20904.1 Protein required for attachment to host cells [Roseovarius halotolerans]